MSVVKSNIQLHQPGFASVNAAPSPFWKFTSIIINRDRFTRAIPLQCGSENQLCNAIAGFTWKKVVLLTIVVGERHFLLSCLLRAAEDILCTYCVYHVNNLCIYTAMYIFIAPPAMTKGCPPTTMLLTEQGALCDMLMWVDLAQGNRHHYNQTQTSV